MRTTAYPLRPRCYFVQYGTIARVPCASGDQSRNVRMLDRSGVRPPIISSGGVGQGFCAALTAREGDQSRTTQGVLWAP